jgi:hypothetical protein
MKISYEAFLRDYTILEHFLKAILKSYSELNARKMLDEPFEDPFDELLKDVLNGRADLKLVVWFKHRQILEDELNF